ncbi:MAG: helix-turn-helix domain-containing protein [Candidatus Eremiobacteraeota bacterium]|nr:helix-turn-helix domain-containing protein [Candidatus Eremiobacteraeota bacterium]
MTETAAARLKRLREERGVTIAALALEAGVSESAVRQLETGNVKSPSFAVGLRLAHYLGVDPYYLAFGESSNLDERLLIVERRVTKLEQRVATIPATRR